MPDELEIILANEIKVTAQKMTLTLEEAIVQMKASGMSNDNIRQILLDDLNNSGRLFGQYKNAVKSSVSNSVGRNSGKRTRVKLEEAGIQQYIWITAGKNTCVDCDPRHGETGTMEYFRTIGLPQSGFSICNTNCQCQLLPQSYKGENLNEPLLR